MRQRVFAVCKQALKFIAGCGVLALSAQSPVSATSSSVDNFRDAGVAAFREARYEEAVENFRGAVQLDPLDQKSRLWLATAYAVQVVPNLQSPENLKIASAAINEFDVVLKADPVNVTAMRQEATVYRNTQQLDKAKSLEKEAIKSDPYNAESWYVVGVIDWQQIHKNSLMVLAKEELTDDGTGNPKLSNAGCDLLEQQNAALVDDGLQSLAEAVRINPRHDEAMQYLNLVYRRRAELHCHDRGQAETDVKLADQWNQKALKARKANETGSK